MQAGKKNALDDDAGRNAATLILRCPVGASKDEGCGLGAEHAADASRLCPSAKAPQHEVGGCGGPHRINMAWKQT
ncbi:hypothetical protein ASF29_19150 [Rhizobium sp. Leaf262]|nr:hypothetical protein ASF29_19150 [Rhizobium sp. Leaf262]